MRVSPCAAVRLLTLAAVVLTLAGSAPVRAKPRKKKR